MRSTSSWTVNGPTSSASASSPPRRNIANLPASMTYALAVAGRIILPSSMSGCRPNWTVQEAHDRLDAWKRNSSSAFQETEILIHVDPGRADRPRNPASAGDYGASNVTSFPFFQVDAFADRPLTGNPAAVMPLERWLDDAVMQAIAEENNLSETAFPVPSQREMPTMICAGSHLRPKSSCAAMRRSPRAMSSSTGDRSASQRSRAF